MAKKRTQSAEVCATMPERKPTMRIELPKGSRLKDEFAGAKFGAGVSVVADGKIKGYRDDEYECSLQIELGGLNVGQGKHAKEEKDEGLAGDMRHLKRARGRYKHMGGDE